MAETMAKNVVFLEHSIDDKNLSKLTIGHGDGDGYDGFHDPVDCDGCDDRGCDGSRLQVSACGDGFPVPRFLV